MMIYLLTVYKSTYAQYNSVNNILLPILMVVGLTSSIVISNQAFAETYQNNRYGYSIWYPSDWIVNGSVWSPADVDIWFNAFAICARYDL